MRSVSVVLCDLRSAHNVGSIFRTADCAGAAKVYLCGTTPAPVDRFGRKRRDLAKVALGAEESVPWEHVPDAKALIRRLKRDGFLVVAVEQGRRSEDYRKIRMGNKAAAVFGNEVGGVPKGVLRLCDKVAEIPMSGKKESLNVSVAAGVALFRFLRR